MTAADYPFNTGPTPDKPWPMVSGGPMDPPAWRGGKPKGAPVTGKGTAKTAHRRSQRKWAKRAPRLDDYDGTLQLVIR